VSTYTTFGQPFVPHDCPHHPGVTVDDVFCPVCLEDDRRWEYRLDDEYDAGGDDDA
jgi:hypothetical protein